MKNTPPTTVAMIVACAAVFMATEFLRLNNVLAVLLIANYNVLVEISNGQWWRLITPIFLHFGIFHLVFNMMWLWMFGQIIEYQNGKVILLLLTAMIAVVSNLIQFYVSGPLFGGMSAVVYGYLGYLIVQGKFNSEFRAELPRAVINLLLGWFVVCWSGILELFGVHVANAAHTAGLVSGLVGGGVGVMLAKLKY